MEYAERTLRSALEMITYDGPINVHIADDGSPEGYITKLETIAKGYPRVGSVSYSNSERGGYGKNYNVAMQTSHLISDYIMCLEDDWELIKPLDVDYLIDVMEENTRFGCIRLGYLGYTDKVYAEIVYAGDNHWLLLDPTSPEKHIFAGHPRLETVQRQRSVGEWPEGLNPGETELAVCSRLNARIGVVWPMNDRISLFAHIGTVRSY